jgi:hypothetical protein
VTAARVRESVNQAAKRQKSPATGARAARSRTHGFTLHIRIAGITVAVTARHPDGVVRVDEATERFLVPPSNPDATVTAEWGSPGERDPGELLFDSGGVWKLYRDGACRRFVFFSPALGPLPYEEATFAGDFTSGVATLRRSCFQAAQSLIPLQYPLDELLLQGLLARGRGAELHACGIIDGSGRGLLFVGQSGAGKTTTARLWEGASGTKVLSDDRIILRRAGSRFVMYGTPWHGEAALADPSSAPLGGVFFLEHGPANALLPVRGAAAATRLFASGFPPFFDREGMDFTLAFFCDLAAEVPCHELHFAPDVRVVEFVQRWAASK